MADANAAVYNRSLTAIHTELDFLKNAGVIAPNLYSHLSQVLPRTYTAGMPPLDLHSAASTPSTEKSQFAAPVAAPAAPPQYSSAAQMQPEFAEAMYDYRPSDESDLPLYRGAQIVVIEKVNPDWWRGRDKSSGREGIFPSSYVRVLDGSASHLAPSPAPYRESYNVSPQPYQAPTPQPYFPPAASPQPQQQPVVVQQQQPQQQQQQQHQQQQQQHQHSGLEKAGKKFGKKLGNAAIFGAGATIGSNIVNSIF
ncbi:protein that induces appearance of [PIN+] prion when overproduced [Myxozyma melibiosi]|uniref:Protein that induces appearance of [PIN+] prion when overproduced n=1 Tax=Myxozyma melibiosi TaxID=54550 RepID=A0ABR1F6I4_9ASCO